MLHDLCDYTNENQPLEGIEFPDEFSYAPYDSAPNINSYVRDGSHGALSQMEFPNFIQSMFQWDLADAWAGESNPPI